MRWIPLLLLLLACDEAPADLQDEALAADEAPPVNPAIAVGRTYALDPASRRYTGSLANYPGVPVPPPGSVHNGFTVLAERGGDLRVRFGVLQQNRQNLCALTTDLDLPRFAPARWGAQQPQAGLNGYLGGLDIPYEDVTIAGHLDRGGRSVSDIRFAGIIDARVFAPLNIGDACLLVAIAGIQCFACADGTPNCLDFSFEDAVAHEVAMPRLVRVDAASRAARGCP